MIDGDLMGEGIEATTNNSDTSKPTSVFEVQAPTLPNPIQSAEAGFKTVASAFGVSNSPDAYFNQQQAQNDDYRARVESAVNNYATDNALANQQNIDRTVTETQQGVSSTAAKIIEGVQAAEKGINSVVEKIGAFGTRCNEKIKDFREKDARISGALASGAMRVAPLAVESVGVSSAILVGVAAAPGVIAYGITRGAYIVGKEVTIRGIALAEKGVHAAVELGGKIAKGTKSIIESVGKGLETLGLNLKNSLEITGRGFKSAYLTEAAKTGIANGVNSIEQKILTGIANKLEAGQDGAGENKEKVLSGIKGLLLEAKKDCIERNQKRSMGLNELRSRIVNGMTPVAAAKAF